MARLSGEPRSIVPVGDLVGHCAEDTADDLLQGEGGGVIDADLVDGLTGGVQLVPAG